MGDRDALLSRLSAWHAAQPWARMDPRQLDIAELRNVGPLEIVLRTEHEVRGVEYQLVPAAQRDLAPPRAPDPWEHTLGIGQRLQPFTDPVALDCTNCSGAGELKCERCDGTGRITAGRRSYPCPNCNGRSVLRCNPCRGSGGMIGTPTIWSRMEVAEVRRTTDNIDLPTEVAVDLADRRAPGDCVWRREAEAIDASMLDASIDAATIALAKELLANAGLPARHRVMRQTLEVHRMSVIEVRRISGATFWVWGEPPALHPANALASPLGRVLPFLAR